MTTNEKIARAIGVSKMVLTPYNWEVVNYFNNYGYRYVIGDATPSPSMFSGEAYVTNSAINCQFINSVPVEVRDIIDKYHPGFMAECGRWGIPFKPVDRKVIWKASPRCLRDGVHITISVFNENCLLIEQAGPTELGDFIITPIHEYDLIQTVLLPSYNHDFSEEEIDSYIESTFGIKMKRFN